jgi:flagellar biosynthesis chaperone FliJ
MTSHTDSGNSAMVEKIITLCEQLLAKVDAAWTLERRAEEKNQMHFEKIMGILTKDMNQYNTQISNLETELASLNDRLNATQSSIEDV